MTRWYPSCRVRVVPVVLATIVLIVLQCLPGGTPAGTPRVLAVGESSVTVTTTLDELNGDTASFEALIAAPGGAGISLREAITAANRMPPGPRLVIAFAIPTSDPGYAASSGFWRIQPGPGALPPLTRGDITIDGTTQPGASGLPYPAILLDGINVYEDLGLSNGLTLASARNTVRGIAVVSFWDTGVVMSGSVATANTIAGCFIGVHTGAAGRQPNYYGIEIRGGASNNLVGGDQVRDRNIISGNDNAGIRIDGSATVSNTITGNWIGLDPAGVTAIGNTYYGVQISGGARNNAVGRAGQGNVISGNGIGVMVTGSNANTIQGNTIGLAPDNLTSVGNRDGGVFLVDGASNNMVGGVSEAERNIISGNGVPPSAFGQGVFVGKYYAADADAARLNRIQGNYIGVDASGILPRGNYRQGVLLSEKAESNTIGGDDHRMGNVITYNGLSGVHLVGTANRVMRNLIGVGADGSTPLGNQKHGVRITGDGNVVGPDNLLAHNQLSGILINGNNNVVQDNLIRNNQRSGICATGPGSTIINNTITSNGGADAPWDECPITSGVSVINSFQTLISSNDIENNLAPGVTIQGGQRNRVLSNRITANVSGGIVLTQNGNNGIAAPLLLAVEPTEVRGIGCRQCRVEIFADADNQGGLYLGSTMARDDGTFSFAFVAGDTTERNITATNTDENGNTSSFASAVNVPEVSTYLVYLPAISH